jgi:hypothetical protein
MLQRWTAVTILEGFRRLNKFVEAIETDVQPQDDLPSLVAHERAVSPLLWGRSVQPGDARKARQAITRQMSLF